MLSGPSGEKKSPARWTRLSLRSKGVVVLTIPLSALVIAQFAIYRVEGDVASVDRQVVRFYDSRTALSQLRTSLSAAQAAVSAYENTGERQYAGVFDQARQSVNQSLSRLPSLVGGTASDEPSANVRREADQEISILDSLRQSPPDAGSAGPRLNRAKAALTS